MRDWLMALPCVAAMSLAAPVGAVTAPPLADYGKLPAAADVHLSPQGDKYAYLAFDQGKRAVVVRAVDGPVLVAFAAGDAKLRGLGWADDTHLVLQLVTYANSDLLLDYGGNVGESVIINAETRKSFGVFAGNPKILGTTLGYYGHASQGGRTYAYFGGLTLSGGGTAAANFDMRRYSLEHAHSDLYRVDVDTGEATVASGGFDKLSSGWLVGGDGQIVARDDYDQKTGERRIYADAGEQQMITRFIDPTGDSGLIGLGRSPGSVLIHQRSPQTDDWSFMEYEARADGRAVDPFDSQATREQLTDSKGVLLGGVTNSDEPRTILFQPALQAKFDMAARAFKGERAQLVSATDNLDRMIVRTEGEGDSGTYFFVNIPAHKASAIMWEYPTILQEAVGPVSVVSYHGADGLELQGVLTLPPGRPGKNLPVVVLPHGGPEARDYAHFDWLAQAFASRGYAVFQPNFRGSDGFGRAFRDAGYGQWGRKMQSDVSDGLAALVRHGVVDPKRACVVGASYGGYVALAGVTLQQGLYRCAVAIAPVSDLNLFLAWREKHYGEQSEVSRTDHAFMGVTSASDPALKALSPADLAAKADAPVLLIHGKQDTTVPFEQSDVMRHALADAGKPVTLVELTGEDHYLSKASTRTQAIEAAVAFVQKNNPPD
jgi:dipeptidyl aminopeptidase/acylaminoacyl peptidase